MNNVFFLVIQSTCRCLVCRKIERQKNHVPAPPSPGTIQPPLELGARPEGRHFFNQNRQSQGSQAGRQYFASQPQAQRRRQRIHPQRNYYQQQHG